MKKCLITGWTGLIGKELVSKLGDWEKYLLGGSRDTDGGVASSVIKHDLNESLRENELPASIDAVVHLAQSEHFRDFPNHSMDVFNVNTASTLRLLEYARNAGATRFILASSGGVYGYGDEGFLEDSPVGIKSDLGFYLSTKLASEILAENYSAFFNVIIIRFFFVYGPRQRSTMLIPRLFQMVQHGQPIRLDGEDGIMINPTYVSDAAEALKRALDLSSSQKINVGGPEILSLREIGEKIGRVTGQEPRFEVLRERQPQHLIGDINKMSSLLWTPSIKFEEGIKSFLDGVDNE